jgi:hypothetical protein
MLARYPQFRSISRVCITLLLLTATWIPPTAARACGVAYYEPRVLDAFDSKVEEMGPPRVDVANEAAIIAWDSKTQTEHFVRRAEFHSNVAGFGFLVPTPTAPELVAVDDDAFQYLENTYEPRHVERTHYYPAPYSLVWVLTAVPRTNKKLNNVASNMDTGVEVVGESHVGDYDTASVRIRNPIGSATGTSATEASEGAGEIVKWLNAHGYQARPDLTKWIEPYVAKHWVITAFKIDKSDRAAKDVNSPAIRMTFHTERPFFPYSEPAEQRAAGAYSKDRLLRIFFIGDARMDGAIDGVSTPWPGAPLWATFYGPYGQYTVSDFKTGLSESLKLNPKSPLTQSWLTVFEDRASPRPGVADLYFTPSAKQEQLEPPPIYVDVDRPLYFPAEPPLLAVILIVAAVRRRQRERQAALAVDDSEEVGVEEAKYDAMVLPGGPDR